MDEETRHFREELLADIGADAHATRDYPRTRFTDRACQILESGEEFSEFHLCYACEEWKKNLVQVDAYSLSEADGVLNLVVVDFSGLPNPGLLKTEEVNQLLNRARRFLEGCIKGDLASLWDESHEANRLATAIKEFASDLLAKVKIYLISDRELGARLGRIPLRSVKDREVEVQIWDISRLGRTEMSTSGKESIVIDFLREYGKGIPALAANLSDRSVYKSFMCVMPGEVLASLYDRYGGRILEQNVRAFLGEGRKVNKGIRETLKREPYMFFAYNNGLTTTVSDLTIKEGADGAAEIASVTDFQVVNGGQTTASLYWAKKSGMDISAVSVQMKLSKLPENRFEEAVHDIARYANAQNAVSASDLFAGHPYFKNLENLSKLTLAPSSNAGGTGSYWFFERTQGGYNVELKRLQGAAAKKWQILRPKRQRLTKTDVARIEVTWASVPHSVSAGAQKNTAAFAKLIEPRWKSDPSSFGSSYFKQLVAKTILVRALDSTIPAQSWYPGSILRQLVTYTIALFADRLSKWNRELDLDEVWKSQAAPNDFVTEGLRMAEKVMPFLQDIPDTQLKNRLVTEWAKREACWMRLKESSVDLSSGYLRKLAP